MDDKAAKPERGLAEDRRVKPRVPARSRAIPAPGRDTLTPPSELRSSFLSAGTSARRSARRANAGAAGIDGRHEELRSWLSPSLAAPPLQRARRAPIGRSRQERDDPQSPRAGSGHWGCDCGGPADLPGPRDCPAVWNLVAPQ